MQTECSPTLFEFEPVERHKVVAGFDGGIITSDAGGLLLGRLDRGLGLIRRMASCFTDRRDPRLLEHTVETLVGQRVFALALGYEDLNDHDELRHDPLFHVLAGKLEAKRSDCAPVAGKSTLNRLEHRPRREAGKYHKIDYDAPSLEALFVDIFLDGHEQCFQARRIALRRTSRALRGRGTYAPIGPRVACHARRRWPWSSSFARGPARNGGGSMDQISSPRSFEASNS